MSREPKYQAYDQLHYGNFGRFMQILQDYDIPFASLNPRQTTSSTSYSGNLEIMAALLEMGTPPFPDMIYTYVLANLHGEWCDYYFTDGKGLKFLKFMLFLMAQPGAPAVEMNDTMRLYLSDARLRPRLIEILAEINKYVSLVSPQAKPMREYLARAGLNVPELLVAAMSVVASNRRKAVLALQSRNHNGSTTGGRRRRRTRRQK